MLVVDDGHDGRLIGVLGVGEAFERQPLLHAWCGIDGGATGPDRAWLLHSFEAVGPYAGMFGRKLLAALATSAEFHELIREQSGSGGHGSLCAMRGPGSQPTIAFACSTGSSEAARSSNASRVPVSVCRSRGRSSKATKADCD
nr:hypothetical protein [Curtobacterium sp. MCPF17_051]